MASIPRGCPIRRSVLHLPCYLYPSSHPSPPQGLSRYQPSNPRATKSLGRFPNRNRFISEYIQKKTGKHRTPKQVGSRLQQLRDTHQGKQRMSTSFSYFSPDFSDLSRSQSFKTFPTAVSISRTPRLAPRALRHRRTLLPHTIIRRLLGP